MVVVLAEAETAWFDDGEAAEVAECRAKGAVVAGAEVAVGSVNDDNECLLSILLLPGSSMMNALCMLIPFGK